LTVQRCAGCGAAFDERAPDASCPRCGGLLDCEHAVTLDAATLKARFAARPTMGVGAGVSGVWRYRELVMPGARDEEIVSHPEGHTPLIARETLRAWAGVDALLIKHEGQNPTGSFKDRGMTVGVTQAKRIGSRAVACASTGNTSASLAAYAANAGIPALVLVPRGNVALGKLTQTLAYGARTLLVDGDFDDCLRLAREAAASLGVYLVNSINPFRIEGQKTIAFELLEQLGWEAPDWIALPAGNLGNVSALGKALREAHALGLIACVPRLLAVQAAGAAPFAEAFREGFATRHAVRAETMATAIRIGDPASWDRGVRAIRDTNGHVASATDEEILEAKAVIDAAGVGCEPASAASVAGVRKLVAAGVIRREERVVAVLTGHVLKDPGILVQYHQETIPAPARTNRPIEIAASLAEIERAMRLSSS
jgi:threonine synthase